uniref:Uncharacterized protein n=1 Tax=Arundo donax TaxID=35708 RepID=A0A0A8XY48_ARUDO
MKAVHIQLQCSDLLQQNIHLLIL